MSSKPIIRDKGGIDFRTLLAAAAKTATGQGDAVDIPRAQAYSFVLDLDAAGTDGTDTLDVRVQTRINAIWVDVVRFAAIDGADSTLQEYAKVTGALGENNFLASAALGAGATRNLIGDDWRVTWTIVDGNDASFTFSVVVMPLGLIL